MRKKTIEDVQRLAKIKGGKCLSGKYINNTTKYNFICVEGHKFFKTYGKLQQGQWCPKCAIRKRSNLLRYSIKDVQKLAEAKGGKCLSTVYVNAQTKYKFLCAKGHKFSSVYSDIQQGCWCPYCAGKRKTIKDVHKLAEAKGGKCLSTEYIKAKSQYNFICSKSHKWTASYNSIQQGSWCPYCVGNKRKAIEDVKRLAEAKGYKCTSIEYINSYKKYDFVCDKGHEFLMSYSNFKQGQRCPVCVGNKKKTIEDVQKLAEANGGNCLSTKYINAYSKLDFICSENHTFLMKYNCLQQNQWCPKCANKRRSKKLKKFTDEQVKEIRYAATLGVTFVEIAKHFQCHWKTISRIINRKIYADVI